jgi:hypothetical protein
MLVDNLLQSFWFNIEKCALSAGFPPQPTRTADRPMTRDVHYVVPSNGILLHFTKYTVLRPFFSYNTLVQVTKLILIKTAFLS